MKPTLFQRPDLTDAREHFRFACFFSRAHADLFSRSLAKYGDKGPYISGCGREHFPEVVKDQLRWLARLVTENTDKAYAARPKGVRMSTMRRLGTAVATRDGSGFYGPQPSGRSSAGQKYYTL